MKFKSFIFVFLILILGLGTILPLLNSGFFSFHDNTQVVRVYEMAQSLRVGMFPVRWVDGLGYGYGYPIFNFYGPLPYYVGGFFSLVGFGSLVSTKLMIGVGMLIAGIAMFLFSRKFFGNLGGILSATLYLYFPYHAINLYVRGAIGELYAYAFLPLVFLGVFSFLKIKNIREFTVKSKSFLFLSISIFLVAVSHILSIFMTLVILFASLILVFFISKNPKLSVLLILFSIIFGLSLSAFFILPSFFEMDYTNVSSQIGGGADFRDHFVCLPQLWESQWGFGGSVGGCLDGLSFKLGKIHILLFSSAIVLLSYNLLRKKVNFTEKITIIAAILFFVSLFFTIEASRFIYQTVNYMEYIQYPWRFLNFAGLFMSFAAGYIFYSFQKQFTKRILVMCLVIALIFILFGYINYFKPQQMNKYNDSYYENEEYVSFTVSKISDEYLPKGFIKPTSVSEVPKERFVLLGSNGSVSTLVDQPNRKLASYNLNDKSVVRANIAPFTSWEAYINGSRTGITSDNNGLNVEVESGNGEIEFKFKQTPIQILGNVISMFAFFLLLIGIMFTKSYGKKTVRT